jgi:hypothetical protein
MRIWDLPPKALCRRHLLGEHVELHALWSILTKGKKGYARHPETLRWKGKLMALYLRHELLVSEMEKRRYHHQSPLDKELATGSAVQDEYVDSISDQRRILLKKGCGCKTGRAGSDDGP